MLGAMEERLVSAMSKANAETTCEVKARKMSLKWSNNVFA